MKRKSTLPYTGLLLLYILCLLLSQTIAIAQPQMPGTRTRVTPAKDPAVNSPSTVERYITIDFNNVDIVVFIKFISELTGKNFIIDQRVKGKVTIISPAKISIPEAYKVFESVLEVHGYTTVQAGEVIKIIPSPDARTKSIETLLEEAKRSPEDKVVTQLIPLRYANPDDIKRLFAPLVSKSSVILSYSPSNMLIITDVYSNIQRLLRILDVIDVVGIGLELTLVALDHADAKKMATLLESVFKSKQKPKKGEPETEIRFVADERTNTLVILASEDDTLRIKKLIAMLDQEAPRGKEKIRVYYLEYAKAEDLLKVLQEIPEKGKAEKGKKAPVVAEDVRMSADKATNSLIIMADKEDYAVLEEIIRKLDIPRSMVYIESLIMEVNVDKSFSLGVEWRALGETSFDNRQGVLGGSFSQSTISESGLLGTAEGGGLTMGIIHGAIDIVTGGETITIPNLTALVKALKTNTDVHILSTPQILTTDNEEARIVVGRNVPFQTRSSQISGTTDTFSSFEYRDVGITLKITPQISKERLIRLNISQELTALTGNPEDVEFKPTTLKRAIDTTVMVEDKSTVVIGGLIDDTFTGRQTEVPCLGNVPGLSWLFRSDSRSNQKTNLYIFLNPHVVKGVAEAKKIYKEKKQDIEGIVEESRIKMYEKNVFDIRRDSTLKGTTLP